MVTNTQVSDRATTGGHPFLVWAAITDDSEVIYLTQQVHLRAMLLGWDSALPVKFDLYSDTVGTGYISTSDADDADALGITVDAGATPVDVTACRNLVRYFAANNLRHVGAVNCPAIYDIMAMD